MLKKKIAQEEHISFLTQIYKEGERLQNFEIIYCDYI